MVNSVPWSLFLSPYASHGDKARRLEEFWVNIWSQAPDWNDTWTAKVPDPLGLAGTYAIIYGHGCVDGDYEILGLTSEAELSTWYEKTVMPPYEVKGELTATTKRRLRGWLKKAYPQRHRQPGLVKGLFLSWGSILAIKNPALREAIMRLFAVQKLLYSEQSVLIQTILLVRLS